MQNCFYKQYKTENQKQAEVEFKIWTKYGVMLVGCWDAVILIINTILLIVTNLVKFSENYEN